MPVTDFTPSLESFCFVILQIPMDVAAHDRCPRLHLLLWIIITLLINIYIQYNYCYYVLKYSSHLYVLLHTYSFIIALLLLFFLLLFSTSLNLNLHEVINELSLISQVIHTHKQILEF